MSNLGIFLIAAPFSNLVLITMLADRHILADLAGRCAIALFYVLCMQYKCMVDAIEIDNGLVAPPTVDCGGRHITVRFRTGRPFTGRAFVKGRAGVDECELGAPSAPAGRPTYGSRQGEEVEFTIKIGTCDMRRQRLHTPDGMQQSVVVIISFHPIFLTKVDRAFHVRCFYMSGDAILTHNLDISMIPTDTISDVVSSSCGYSLRVDSPEGPEIRFARVGMPLFHVWHCELRGNQGILVRNCYINGGVGKPFLALDSYGCPTDLYVMPYLTYNPSMHWAFVETHAFKFADRQSLSFQCEITICQKDPGAPNSCQGITPPSCSHLPSLPQTSGANAPAFRPAAPAPASQFEGPLGEVTPEPLRPIPPIANAYGGGGPGQGQTLRRVPNRIDAVENSNDAVNENSVKKLGTPDPTNFFLGTPGPPFGSLPGDAETGVQRDQSGAPRLRAMSKGKNKYYEIKNTGGGRPSLKVLNDEPAKFDVYNESGENRNNSTDSKEQQHTPFERYFHDSIIDQDTVKRRENTDAILASAPSVDVVSAQELVVIFDPPEAGAGQPDSPPDPTLALLTTDGGNPAPCDCSNNYGANIALLCALGVLAALIGVGAIFLACAKLGCCKLPCLRLGK